jgi:hypothetical protein
VAREFVLANAHDPSKAAELASELWKCLEWDPSRIYDCPAYRVGRALRSLFGDGPYPEAIQQAEAIMQRRSGRSWLYVGD